MLYVLHPSGDVFLETESYKWSGEEFCTYFSSGESVTAIERALEQNENKFRFDRRIC